MPFLNKFCLIIIFTLFTQACSSRTLNGFDLSDSLIPVDKIFRGGPPRDGIPALNDPEFLRPDKADFIKDKDRVIGVHHNGIAKAYPIKILNWHEIVNDHFGEEAILISYCPLCNTGMVFSAQGKAGGFTFGVSGLLYNSDVLLFDRQTGSLWSQIMSRSISGKLKNTTLNQIPASHTTWRLWLEQHPDTKVLSTNTGHNRNYKRSPYMDYAKNPQLMFSVENRNKAYRNKELVLGITIGNYHKAYPFKELRKLDQSSFTDQFEGRTLNINWHKKDKTATIKDTEGNELPTVLAYWFAWYAFFPETEIFKAGK